MAAGAQHREILKGAETMEFNFTGLKAVFAEAVKRYEPTILFSLQDGLGQFVFMIFLETDSKGKIKFGDLELFVIFGRTQQIYAFPLYGNFLKDGDFRIFLNADHVRTIRDELGIPDNADGPPFVVSDFLGRLNTSIPQSIPLTTKIDLMQNNRQIIERNCVRYLDEADKIFLLGPRPLPSLSRPREETLRKLYMLSQDPATIGRLIDKLKARNWTVAWSKIERSPVAFADLWSKVNA